MPADAGGYPPPTDEAYVPPAPEPVVSVYVDPPMQEPEPIGVPWAPPPMMVEDPGPMPYYGAVWTGGYWVWEGQWVWARGRWMGPPMVGYAWTQPYYENRGGIVVFTPGYWAAPGAVFVAPAVGVTVAVVVARPGVVMGPPCCQGPVGVFVPPPPGSRLGIIVPAPVGTSPAVVVGAPPVVRPGMMVQPGDGGHVRIAAPAGVTANGRPVSAMAPREAHLAAAQAPVVRVAAPEPVSRTPIPSYSPKRGYSHLPEARPVHPVVAQPNQLQHAPQTRAPGAPGAPATLQARPPVSQQAFSAAPPALQPSPRPAAPKSTAAAPAKSHPEGGEKRPVKKDEREGREKEHHE